MPSEKHSKKKVVPETNKVCSQEPILPNGCDEILPIGSFVSKYIIRSRLERGREGSVYQAYDPELGRLVAIKLMRNRFLKNKQKDNDLLLREAQAMAQLSHPNVLQVYEVGTFRGQIYMVMDYIEGTTIKEWVKAKKRSWEEVVNVMQDAARGLAAAQKVGLIHHEFTSANVLINQEGIGIVTDFGGGSQECMSNKNRGVQEGDPINTMTVQYCFFTTLFELLNGHRPEDECTNEDRIIPTPGWLKRTIEKEISLESNHRYDSMDQVVKLLGKDPKRFIKRTAMLLGLIVLVGILATQVFTTFQDKAKLCQGAQKNLAGVWDQGTKLKVEKVFLASKRPYAKDTFEKIEKFLDLFSNNWIAMYTEACQATYKHQKQSGEILDLRMGCLSAKLQEVGVLIDVFGRKPDGVVVDKAVQAVTALEGLGRCADLEALLAAYPPPEDRATRLKVTQLSKQLDEIEALIRAGKYIDGDTLSKKIGSQIETMKYPPLQARFLYHTGSLQEKLGQYDKSIRLLKQALRYASKARNDNLVAKISSYTLFVLGVRQSNFRQALNLVVFTNIACTRESHVLAKSYFLRTLGTVFWQNGVYTKAQKHLQKAIKLTQYALGPNHPDLATSLNNLGVVTFDQGYLETAFENHSRALKIRKAALGPNHPDVAMSLNNLGHVTRRRGDLEKAFEYYLQTYKILIASLGPNHINVAASLNNLGLVSRKIGQLEEAIEYYSQALKIYKEAFGSNHPDVAMSLNNLGTVAYSRGDFEKAFEYLSKAFKITQNTLGPTHPMVASSLGNLGVLAEERGKLAEAFEYYSQALKIQISALGPKHPHVAENLSNLGSVLIKKRQWDRAKDYYQRADSICQEITCDPLPAGTAKFGLARITRRQGKEVQALKLAKVALKEFSKQPLLERKRKEVEAFLKDLSQEK